MQFLKNFIFDFDKIFLSGRIKRKRIKLYIDKTISQISEDHGWIITTHYSKNQNDHLSLLCDLYGSDKGESREGGHPYAWASHSYSDYYSRMFWRSRTSVTKVFECGIGTNNPNLPSTMGSGGKPGASLRVWRDYFPNATIFGADIDREILFQEDRIRTFYIDQLSPQSILDFWSLTESKDFDFICDDGLHTFEAGSTLFRYSIESLSPRGVYVIEDVSISDLLKYKVFLSNLTTSSIM